MGNFRARAFLVAGLTCFGVACSSAPSDPPPLVSPDTTDDATVTLPADDTAKAAGVYWWNATMRQTDDVLPGAIDVDDMPANSGRVTIEIVGQSATRAPVVVGRFALATAMALALPDDAGHAALATIVSGTYLAHANRDGSRAADFDSVTELTLFRSFASTLASWTPPADGASPAALEPKLHIDSPMGADSANATTSCPGTAAEIKALQKASLQDLGKLVHALLENASAMCNPLTTDPPLLARQRADLFGVNGMLNAADLQAAGVHHVRGTFAHGAWANDCKGTTFTSFATAQPLTEADFKAKFQCVFDGFSKQMAQYKGLEYPNGDAYPVDATMLIPHLDGFESVRDSTGSEPYPPKDKNVTYEANQAWDTYAGNWKQYACAAIAAATAADPPAKTFELWNEPDDAGNAPIPASLLAPMLVDLIAKVRDGGCVAAGVDGKSIDFSIGAASVGYYNQVLSVPDAGPTLLSDLAFYNLHPYNNWPGETQGDAQAGGVMADSNEFASNGESLADTLRDLQTKIMPLAGFKPIVFSEWGYDHGMPACEGGSQTSCTCAWSGPAQGSSAINACGAGSPTISCPDLAKQVASGACDKTNHPQLPAYCNGGCVLSRDQCKGEVKEIQAFYTFFANPPSDIAPLANAVHSADLYGFPRHECDGADRNALKAQADHAKANTDTSCTDDKLRQLILGLRKTQTMANFLCCKNSISSWAGFASTIELPRGGACNCFESTHGASPYKNKDGKCVTCPVGPSVDSIAGCLSAAAIAKDSCTMPTVRAPGWYCSELVDDSAFHCTADHTLSLGAQCSSGQKCHGGAGAPATANDDGSGLVCDGT